MHIRYIGVALKEWTFDRLSGTPVGWLFVFPTQFLKNPQHNWISRLELLCPESFLKKLPKYITSLYNLFKRWQITSLAQYYVVLVAFRFIDAKLYEVFLGNILPMWMKLSSSWPKTWVSNLLNIYYITMLILCVHWRHPGCTIAVYMLVRVYYPTW